MDFRETLAALLPSPRDDEPPSLRQDIMDELADHLSSAYHRELLRGSDPTTARARVLDRFGDPATMARRLWLEAMRGKFMLQRALIATCLVVTLVSLSLAGVLWVHGTQTARQLAEAERRMAESLAQAQSTNKDMLNKLSEMSEAIRHPRSPDWNPVTFKLTEETPDGPPVAASKGCTLNRSGESPATTIRSDLGCKGRCPLRICFARALIPSNSQKIGPAASKVLFGQTRRRTRSEVHKSIVCPKDSAGTRRNTHQLRLAG